MPKGASGQGAFREIDGHPVFIKGAEPIPGHQPPWKREGAAHASSSGGTQRPMSQGREAAGGAYVGSPSQGPGREVVEAGKRTGIEHVIVTDAHGQVKGKASGDEGTTDLPSVKEMDTPGANLHVHHNHPDNGPLSLGDLDTLAAKAGIQTITAYGHGGTNYTASVPSTGDRNHLYRESRRIHNEIYTREIEKTWDLPAGPDKRATVIAVKHDVMAQTLAQLHDKGLIHYQKWSS